MGGPNLEVFKFGLYIMFPIAIMYYYGTNLDERFSVPGFWPKPENTNRIPYERKDMDEFLAEARERRLRYKARQEHEAQMVTSQRTSERPKDPE